MSNIPIASWLMMPAPVIDALIELPTDVEPAAAVLLPIGKTLMHVTFQL